MCVDEEKRPPVQGRDQSLSVFVCTLMTGWTCEFVNKLRCGSEDAEIPADDY